MPKVSKSLPPSRKDSGTLPAAREDREGWPDGGACVVCGGDVAEMYVGRESRSGGSHSGRQDGFHCLQCGLRYAFMPPPVLRVKVRRSLG